MPEEKTKKNKKKTDNEDTRSIGKSDIEKELKNSRKTSEQKRKPPSKKAVPTSEKKSVKSAKKKTQKVKKSEIPTGKPDEETKIMNMSEIQETARLSKNNQHSEKRNLNTEPEHSGNTVKKKKRKKKKKKSILIRIREIFYIILILIIAVIIFAGVMAKRYIDMLDRVEPGTRNLISLSSDLISSADVKNILVIGADGRTLSDDGRSDTIILLSLNEHTREMNMISFMRDMYVTIPNYGQDKINSAYSYGGANLLMDTIEENFGIKVDDYIIVNFTSFTGIVDAVGGIEITLSDEEAEEVNNILRNEVNELMGDEKESDFLESGGTYRLNGKQALCYSRIRYVGDADFERTQRQREVLSKLVDEAKTFNVFTLDSILSETLPQVTTNMNSASLYECALKLPIYLGYDIKQIRVPMDGSWQYAEIDGSSVITLDFNDNILMLAEEIYDIKYEEQNQK